MTFVAEVTDKSDKEELIATLRTVTDGKVRCSFVMAATALFP